MIFLNNPLTDPYLVLNKIYSGGKYIKQAIKETPLDPLNKAASVKIIYGVLEKDVYLEYIIGANAERSPKTAVKIILKIALYMLEFLHKHDYMVVDYAVELAKKAGKSGAAGFINAFLRSYKLPPMPENTAERISVENSAPLWLVKKLRRSYRSECIQILSAQSYGVCVRFVRGSEKYLNAPHIQTPFKDVYIFKNFVLDEGFYAGDYTVQSVGSVAICSAICGGERLLDGCAAPGGKSVLLSQKFREVVSCDIHAHRVALIEEYARRMGVENVCAVQADSSVYNADFEEKFDAVLCDAPCSGTGVINENPDIKLFRKESDIASLTKVQLSILGNLSRYVKCGGTLFYSTCSVLPEENDSVAHNFLQLHPEYALNIPDSPLEHLTSAYGIQFLPHISLGAGFYLTAFKKTIKAGN